MYNLLYSTLTCSRYSLFFSTFNSFGDRCTYNIFPTYLNFNDENATKYIFKETQVLLHIISYLCACPARRDKIIYIREIAFEIKQALNERRLRGKFFRGYYYIRQCYSINISERAYL